MVLTPNGSLLTSGSKDKSLKNKTNTTLGVLMQTQNKKSKEFYRFQIQLPTTNPNQKPKSIGMAYLRDGEGTYTIRLWMFNERYYMIKTKNDPTRYLLMSRELSHDNNAKNKYRWRIIGNGKLDLKKSVIELYFDLLNKPVLMNLYPESYVDKTLSDETIETTNIDDAIENLIAA